MTEKSNELPQFIVACNRAGVAHNNRAGGQWILCATDSELTLLAAALAKPAGDALSFEDAARPLMKWLNDNCHPHHTVVVTPTSAELLEGKQVFQTQEFLKD